MSEGKRLLTGFFAALILHLAVLGAVVLSGALEPPPPAKPEEVAEVSMIDEPELPAPEPEEILPDEEAPKEQTAPEEKPPEKKEEPKPPEEAKPVPPKKKQFLTVQDIEGDAPIAHRAPRPSSPVLQPDLRSVAEKATAQVVEVELIVEIDGTVSAAVIGQTSGSAEIDRRFLEAARREKFVPGMDEQGKPIRCRAKMVGMTA